MQKSRKERVLTFIPILFILIFSIGVFYFNYEYDCGSDVSCYDRHLKRSCEKTRLTITEEGSTFVYQILGREGDSCNIRVTLEDLPQATGLVTAELFEGKSMTCRISPNSEFNSEILPSCTGPLKESIYELTIQKMYNILAQSLGDIADKI